MEKKTDEDQAEEYANKHWKNESEGWHGAYGGFLACYRACEKDKEAYIKFLEFIRDNYKFEETNPALFKRLTNLLDEKTL